jgi:hypothetical protein
VKDIVTAMSSFELALGQFMQAHQHKAPADIPSAADVDAACRDSHKNPQIPTQGKSP